MMNTTLIERLVAALPPYMKEALDKVIELRDRKALFVVSHSGGKDSDVMNVLVSLLVPPEQRLALYAELGDEVVWPETKAHIRATTDCEFAVCKAVDAAGYDKDFFDMLDMNVWRFIRQRMPNTNPWPEPTIRQCTSDLKTNPIDKAIRHILKGRDNKLVVVCVGLRATESAKRAPGFGTKDSPVAFKYCASKSKAGREWYEWLPIHHFRCRTDQSFLPGVHKDDVFDTLDEAGVEPFWTYDAGMSRLSCSFCIMASKADIAKAAELRPVRYAAYVAKERELGKSMMMPPKGSKPVFLEEFCGVKADPVLVEEFLAEFKRTKPERNRRVLRAYLAHLSKDNRAILTGSVMHKSEVADYVAGLSDDEVVAVLTAPAFTKEDDVKPEKSALDFTCDAKPTKVSLGSLRMTKRPEPKPEPAPRKRVTGGKLNAKEERVMEVLASGGWWSLSDLSKAAFGTEVGGADSTSWVRNSLRKLKRLGLVERVDRGVFRASGALKRAA